MLKNQMFKHSKLVRSMFTLRSLITENDYLINKEAQPGRNASVCWQIYCALVTAPYTTGWNWNGASMSTLEKMINKREQPAACEFQINLRAETVQDFDFMQYWQHCSKPMILKHVHRRETCLQHAEESQRAIYLGSLLCSGYVLCHVECLTTHR